MPGTVVQARGGSTGTATASTSITPAFLSASVTGNWIVLVITSNNTVTTPSGWALERSQVNGDGHYHYSRTSAGETTFAAVTISQTTCWYLLEISGLVAAPLDKTVSAGSGTNTLTSQSTGTTTALAQTDELCVASWGSSANPGAGNTASGFSAETNSYVEVATDVATTNPGTTIPNVGLGVATRSVSATTPQTSTATLTPAGAPTAMIVTYKAAAVAAGGARPVQPHGALTRRAHARRNAQWAGPGRQING